MSAPKCLNSLASWLKYNSASINFPNLPDISTFSSSNISATLSLETLSTNCSAASWIICIKLSPSILTLLIGSNIPTLSENVIPKASNNSKEVTASKGTLFSLKSRIENFLLFLLENGILVFISILNWPSSKDTIESFCPTLANNWFFQSDLIFSYTCDLLASTEYKLFSESKSNVLYLFLGCENCCQNWTCNLFAG